jgi:hypothetical protein
MNWSPIYSQSLSKGGLNNFVFEHSFVIVLISFCCALEIASDTASSRTRMSSLAVALLLHALPAPMFFHKEARRRGPPFFKTILITLCFHFRWWCNIADLLYLKRGPLHSNQKFWSIRLTVTAYGFLATSLLWHSSFLSVRHLARDMSVTIPQNHTSRLVPVCIECSLLVRFLVYYDKYHKNPKTKYIHKHNIYHITATKYTFSIKYVLVTGINRENA